MCETYLHVKPCAEPVAAIPSDTADELHLHGYNLHLPRKPGRMGDPRSPNDAGGRFTYELHRPDRELGALEAYPR